jgi:hypothetical protein
MFSLEWQKDPMIVPTLFIIFINDIDLAIDVTDDTKVGMVVETEEQRDELQADITNLEPGLADDV